MTQIKVVEATTKPSRDSRNRLLGTIAKRDIEEQFKKLVESVPNPDSILKKIGAKINEYSRIKEDPHVASCIQSRKSGVLSMSHEIQPDKATDEVTAFVEDVFKYLPIHRILEEMLDYSLFGFQVMEINWIERLMPDGNLRILPIDVVGKGQSKFTFDSQNMLRLVQGRKISEPLSNSKFLLLQSNATFDNPYGEGILARCYWSVKWKQNGLSMFFKFLEKFGQPMVHVEVTDGDLEDSGIYDNFAEEVENMIEDSYMITDQNVRVTLLNANVQANTDVFKNLILLCNSEISKGILSQTLTTEQGRSGSYAMSQTHMEVRKDVIDSDTKGCITAFNLLIDLIVDFNFGKNAERPKFRMYSEAEVNLVQAQTHATILQADPRIKPSKEYYIKTFGWTNEDFELIDQLPAFANESDVSGISQKGNQTNKKIVDNKTIQELLDEAIANTLRDSAKDFNSAVVPVRNYLESKGSFESAISSIMDLYDDFDYEEARIKLEQILFVSDIVGRMSINQHVE